jgi:hypothetical protein
LEGHLKSRSEEMSDKTFKEDTPTTSAPSASVLPFAAYYAPSPSTISMTTLPHTSSPAAS